METTATFNSGGFELEGSLFEGDKEKGAIVTHPHPLYGGNMQNNVVSTVSSAYQKSGFTTLRFNFRGVGRSQGSYGDGVGEQEDVRAAVARLRDLGIRHIELAGYSFGAWVNARAANEGLRADRMVMVSPPVAFIEFKDIANIGSLKLIVTGSRDDIAPANMVEKSYPAWNAAAEFAVINGADHFYGGYEGQLEAVLMDFLSQESR
jgi:alpha/beta superfamily hydrolase